jgi:hypothetical protein
MLHALRISSLLTWSFKSYLAKNRSHEAPHYAAVSNFPLLHLSLVQIFSSASCS